MTTASTIDLNVEREALPRHVAIIMDGNGRWARKRALPRHAGHRAGVKPVRKVVERAAQKGVDYLTLFAFSTENWSRPRDEVSRLMRLFFEALQRELDELHRNNVRVRFIGARGQLHDALMDKITEAEIVTADNTGLNLIIAVAYGGRWDIVSAARRLLARAKDEGLDPTAIDEQMFSSELQLAGVPDADLLIRTGGEQRISNFLLWNLAYAELYFSDTLWPDFRDADFDAAISHFAGRQRRYGHTGEQIGAA